MKIFKYNQYIFYLYFLFFLNLGIFLGRYIFDENYRYYLYVWYPDQIKEIDHFFAEFKKFRKAYDFPENISYQESRVFIAKNIDRLQNFVINKFSDIRNLEVVINEQKDVDMAIEKMLDNFN